MVGYRLPFKRIADEITAQYKGAIVFDFAPVKMEKCVLGLEVTDL